ncbi:phage shock protein C (PspC) family protein [Longilinea arvoryzae]|uniref:Phage shock protein C (PspC) family protein n=1 Tax=Longilinea arvoryzae TaxID=360412 RepID=A0A0S7BBL2_9CHLR|nr:PspC domain-containing protein [Longilinea arvoryzae]GAP15038.1 phage shock protein C (PspC) family protein [Longilinea arvoryzae]
MNNNTRNALRRSRTDRVIAGVCGGLGAFFGIDPVWFRLGFLVTFLPGGVPGLLLYLICWIIIPSE